MINYSNTMKVCATCSYWDGTRQAKGILCSVESNCVGKCYVLAFTGVTKYCQETCPKWDKWKALR